MPITETGCHIFIGKQNGKGYGQLHISGIGNRVVHRLVWENVHGVIPDGMCIAHRCDIPSCCNPDHLFLATHAENMADMGAKGRARSGLQKLTLWQVEEIRSSGEKLKPLSLKYGVSMASISRARNGVHFNKKGVYHG